MAPGLPVFLAWMALQGAAPARVSEAYGRLPLSFEANRGQADPRVRFLSRGRGYTLFLTSGGEAVWASPASLPLRIRLLGADRAPSVRGLDELTGKSNYLIGSDPARWLTGVPSYARVEYREVYPGVNLVYYGTGRQLEYDFVLAPGADARRIRLAIHGAKKLELDSRGDLVLHLPGGQIRFGKPVVYQEVDGVRREIAGRYTLRGKNQIAFSVAAYDETRPLVIDPALVYSTYLGGSGYDQGLGIALDSSGNAYITGYTDSINFPTANPLTTTYGGGFRDVFVAKLNAAGTALVYSTYLGGSDSDFGNAIAVDASGNAYLAGTTLSPNFPTTPGAFQTSGAGCFVAKLNTPGNALVYSTLLHNGGCVGIALDASGNAYVTGRTGGDFPTHNPLQAAYGGAGDAFVAKLNAAGSTLVYSTYLGGSEIDEGHGIALDSSGNAYVIGWTRSADFPTANPWQPAHGGSLWDAFVAKVNAAGSGLVYSTYLGGSSMDFGNAIAVDASGNAYITGSTSSSDFPTTPGAFQTSGGRCFVAKLGPAGASAVYSTLFSAGDCLGIAVDASGNACFTGTTSGLLPAMNPLQAASGGFVDAFVAKLNAAGSGLVYSTYLGGSSFDYGNAVALDSAGNAYVVGEAGYAFPTANALQPSNGGDFKSDAFVAKITEAPGPCTYSVSPMVQDFFGNGGAGSVTVTAASGCRWTASSNDPFITITSGGSGEGPGTMAYSVPASPSTSPRTGTVSIAGQVLVVRQASLFLGSLAPAGATAGGPGFTLAANGLNFIPRIPGPVGTNGSVALWNGSPRPTTFVSNTQLIASIPASDIATAGTARVTVSTEFFGTSNALDFAINPPGTAGCTYSITPASQDFFADGGTASVAVTTASGCSWTASGNPEWITIIAGRGGSGSGTVTYAVAANSGAFLRTGTIIIGGQVLLVAQSVPLLASLSPAGATAGGPDFTLTVNGAGFTQTFFGGSSGTNPGSEVRWNGSPRPTTFVSPTRLTASIPARDIVTAGTAQVTAVNPEGRVRLGGGTSNPLTFTVLPLGCTYSISPTGLSVIASAGTFGVSVTAGGGCNWTAVSNVIWIVPTSAASGSGSGSVSFAYEANTLGAGRTGTVAIAGITFTLTQGGFDPSAVAGPSFEPGLKRSLAPGFYIVEATLAPGATGGFWGLEVITSLGQAAGGFNLGGALHPSAAFPGFGAFLLSAPQTVTATVNAQLPEAATLAMRFLDNNRQPIGNPAGGAPPLRLSQSLVPGFYIVEVRNSARTPVTYQLELAADLFAGGTNTGGYVGPGIIAFGAFYVPEAQDVTMKLYGRSTYGPAGAGNLVLTLRDSNRTVLQVVSPP